MPASIWLQLSGEADGLLRGVIAGLATRYGTMPFQPHLTVCGIPPDDRTVADAAAGFVKSCGVLPLRVAKSGISYSTTAPFKAVVIDIQNVPELHNFRDGLRRITGAAPFEPPHISLLYTIDTAQNIVPWATDPAQLREIAADAAHRIHESEFTLDAPVIVITDGEWSNIASWTIHRQL
jgi:hypothetical protein